MLEFNELAHSAGVAELADAQDLGTNFRPLQTKGLLQKHAT
jgi:hypothetical protein